eukprot:Selendium_serpulae@DN6261_c4_g1_i3.p2
MFSKLKNSINDAVESAGGYEKIASQGLEYLKKDHNQDKKEAKSDSSDDDEDKKKWDCCPLTGNRKALLIGINYKGMPEELRGCINDVHAMKKYIVDKQGFKTDDDHMLILTEQEAKHNHPTRSRMLEGIRWLIKDAKAGDSLFFHFSGHGTRVPDEDGDEAAGGACTNAFLAIMLRTADITYVELLDEMRKMLKEKNFTQLPCLSSSRKVPLGAKFNMHH